VGLAFEPRGDPIGYFTKCIREYGECVSSLLGCRCVSNRPDASNQCWSRSIKLREIERLQGAATRPGNGLLTSEGEFWRRQRQAGPTGLSPGADRGLHGSHGGVLGANARLLEGRSGARRARSHDAPHARYCGETLSIRTYLASGGRWRSAQFLMGSSCAAAFAFLLPASIPIPTTRRLRRAVGSSTKLFMKLSAGGAPATRCQEICSVFFCRHRTMKPRHDRSPIARRIMTLFLAGHETTANALSGRGSCSAHPEVEEKLVEELRRVLGGRAPTRPSCLD